jgi:protein-L-isoaspartate O-methyltransferase
MQSPSDSVPTLAELATLAGSERLEDRAFAGSLLQLGRVRASASELNALYERVCESARRAHTNWRTRTAEGHFDRAAFLRVVEQQPVELRNHWVEEALGIAYPPLQLRQLPQELVSYSPSGIAEVLFMLDSAALGPGRTLVDLGAGLGKVALLAALLSGATAIGIELDPALVTGARTAASELGLGNASFIEGDLRQAPIPEADVYYMFIPLQRSAQLLERLEPLAQRRPFSLFAQGLDLSQTPWLRRTGDVSYWLERFEAG